MKFCKSAFKANVQIRNKRQNNEWSDEDDEDDEQSEKSTHKTDRSNPEQINRSEDIAKLITKEPPKKRESGTNTDAEFMEMKTQMDLVDKTVQTSLSDLEKDQIEDYEIDLRRDGTQDILTGLDRRMEVIDSEQKDSRMTVTECIKERGQKEREQRENEELKRKEEELERKRKELERREIEERERKEKEEREREEIERRKNELERENEERKKREKVDSEKIEVERKAKELEEQEKRKREDHEKKERKKNVKKQKEEIDKRAKKHQNHQLRDQCPQIFFFFWSDKH